MRAAKFMVGVTLGVALSGAGAWAQGAATDVKAGSDSVRTFYLSNVSQTNDANELVTALRNLLDPAVKIYLVQSENAISVRGTPEQLALVQKVLTDLDRPRKAYRLTYTITEMDGTKRIGAQHFAMIVVVGGRTTLKNGSKVPVVTGAYNPGTSTQNTQVTYLDVGLNIDASLDQFENGARLRSKVEQSSVAEEKSPLGTQDPVVRQSVMEGTSFLTPGKPLVLGSLDMTGSTRHLDIEVVMEAVR